MRQDLWPQAVTQHHRVPVHYSCICWKPQSQSSALSTVAEAKVAIRHPSHSHNMSPRFRHTAQKLQGETGNSSTLALLPTLPTMPDVQSGHQGHLLQAWVARPTIAGRRYYSFRRAFNRGPVPLISGRPVTVLPCSNQGTRFLAKLALQHWA